MGALLPHLPLPLTHRLSRDLRCPPLLSLYGRLGKQPLGARRRRSCLLASWSLPRSRCASAHLLSKAHTWANQSQIIGEQLPSQSSLPKLAKQTHCLFLGGHPHTCFCPKEDQGTPCPSRTSPLLPEIVAWSSACAQLWLLTARSAAAAPRCQDLFRERAGGAKTRWAEEEEEEGARTYWSIGATKLISPSDSPQLPSAYLPRKCSTSQCTPYIFNPVGYRVGGEGGKSGQVPRKGVYP